MTLEVIGHKTRTLQMVNLLTSIQSFSQDIFSGFEVYALFSHARKEKLSHDSHEGASLLKKRPYLVLL